MPTLEVKCTVSNCFFHAKGDICGAEKIEINSSNRDESAEFAADFDRIKEHAAHSTNTCCKTFRAKGEQQSRNRLM